MGGDETLDLTYRYSAAQSALACLLKELELPSWLRLQYSGRYLPNPLKHPARWSPREFGGREAQEGDKA